MRILYDYQIFTNQRYGGISRYFTELITRLGADADVRIAARYAINEHLRESGAAPRLFRERGLNFDFVYDRMKFFGAWTLGSSLNRLLQCESNLAHTFRLLRENRFDVFHPTYYDPYFFTFLQRPLVVTVYDMTHEKYAPFYTQENDFTSDRKRTVVERADRIIAISRNTRDDLVRMFGVPQDKVDVIYLANSLDPDSAEPVETPPRYVLFVGLRGYYKNFTFAARSLAPLLLEHDLHLVCAGDEPFTEDEEATLTELDIRDRTLHRTVTEGQLATLYRQALFLVFPSDYEGFGLPVVEAFANRCPVLLAEASCLPEIAEDAAAYFTPGDEDALAANAEELVLHDARRQELIDRGRQRARAFNWQTTAAQTLRTYRKALS